MRLALPTFLLATIFIWSPIPAVSDETVFDLLIQQQLQIEDLQRRLGEHEQVLQRLPSVEQSQVEFNYASHLEAASHATQPGDHPTHYVGYDKGFFIRPHSPADTPFELKVNGRIQFRHTAFDRQADSYFNRATGMFVPIESRNDFEIERGRLAFSGFVHDPNLQYFINLDIDTDDNHRVVAQDFWFNYEFSDLVNLYVGKAFIPGSREWLDGALQMRLGDRSMATTFFRPDRTIGIWSIGNLTENLKYRAMLGNGFQTADLTPDEIDRRFLVAASTWWTPLADYGSGYSDLEWHEDLAVRLGSSFTFSSQEGRPDGKPRAEQAFVRLSDGVRLVDPGALAPGVTVNQFDIYLFAADLAGKYRGFSFNGEFYARWLNNLSATGPLPLNEIYTDGFYFDAGYMLCPSTLELNGRVSTVNGMFGDAWEYAFGVNYFIHGHNNKLTFDATYLDGCPVTNTGTNYRVGDRGVMFRSQWQVAF